MAVATKQRQLCGNLRNGFRCYTIARHHTALTPPALGIAALITLEWIIALLLGAVVLSALARRVKVPYPAFLAIGGVLLAFLPSGPSWTLEPDLALALFVAPVLLDAAFDTSLRDLRNNWLPVSTLVVAAVGVSTAAVAATVLLLVPGMPWSAAIALEHDVFIQKHSLSF
jgi:monovalent cation/hydrogen antiporter